MEDEKNPVATKEQAETKTPTATLSSSPRHNAGGAFYSIARWFRRKVTPVLYGGCSEKDFVDAARKNEWKFVINQYRSHHVDLDSADPTDGSTALICSARNGSTSLVCFLVENGCDVDICDREGRSALLWACRNKYSKIAKHLITQGGANVDLEDAQGLTALLCLCRNTRLTRAEGEIALLIAERSTNVNAAQKKDGLAALHFACRFGHGAALVDAILKGGADASLCDNEGFRPLHWACRGNNLAAARQLLYHAPKLDMNARARDGRTSAELAAIYGTIEFTRYLLMKGASIPVEPPFKGEESGMVL